MTDDFLRLFILGGWGTERGRSLSLQPSMYIEARNLHTVDVLDTMWDRYRTLRALLRDMGECSLEPFHWYRVSTLLAPGTEAFTAWQLEHISSDQPRMKRFTIRKGWVQWLLEHAWVHLQGFDFGHSCTIPASTSFRIWSEDGVTWHLAFESHKKEIKSGTVLACDERPPGLVNSGYKSSRVRLHPRHFADAPGATSRTATIAAWWWQDWTEHRGLNDRICSTRDFDSTSPSARQLRKVSHCV